ncbi:hypothetical protein NIASO_10155 [Niabella soli DSM 19437]|uniref:Uncharacterized protein n=1 Tax=Niabella soli DSM 19437 TaxID=929713 RepID=W0F7Y9_9BACT|nr:hypothetical protein NIASO_10155 [Niabella soli DSM 19437]
MQPFRQDGCQLYGTGKTVMRKIAHILALLILFISSSADTVQALVPAGNNAYVSTVNDRQHHKNNNTQDLGNDHIITNRFCSHFINKTDLFSQRKFYSILSLPVFELVAFPSWSHLSPVSKQLPGYGHLFLYYLF